MNWLDLLILAVLLASLIMGLVQGFVSTLTSLIGGIVGVLLASRFYQPLAKLLSFIPNESIANIAAFVVILLAVLIVAAIIGKALKSVLAAVHLGCFDRIAGGVLGLFLGFIFMSAVLAGFVKFFGEGTVTQSSMAKLLLDRFPLITGLMPSQFGSIRDFFK
jgi:membrane protein required for colicin V production